MKEVAEETKIATVATSVCHRGNNTVPVLLSIVGLNLVQPFYMIVADYLPRLIFTWNVHVCIPSSVRVAVKGGGALSGNTQLPPQRMQLA